MPAITVVLLQLTGEFTLDFGTLSIIPVKPAKSGKVFTCPKERLRGPFLQRTEELHHLLWMRSTHINSLYTFDFRSGIWRLSPLDRTDVLVSVLSQTVKDQQTHTNTPDKFLLLWGQCSVNPWATKAAVLKVAHCLKNAKATFSFFPFFLPFRVFFKLQNKQTKTGSDSWECA